MLSESLERRVLLAPSHAKAERVVAFLRAVLRRIPHTISLWSRHVETRHAMAMLSDHMLRDIGLTRNDVERQLLKPFWRD